MSSLLTKEEYGFTSEDAAALVSSLISRGRSEEKNVPLEQQLYAKKLLKLRQLIEFFQQLEKLQPAPRQVISNEPEVLAKLRSKLSIGTASYVETLLLMMRGTEETPDSQLSSLSLWDFLICFELEGELQSSDR